jgi:hypothetical protein
VLEKPSPKSHCQEVGEPVDVSVNCTAWLTAGNIGMYVKDAVRVDEELTLTIWLPVFDPDVLLTSKVTV